MTAIAPVRAMPQVAFPDGVEVPALGQGTWTMGEHREDARVEIAALNRGLDLGLTLIDTAEMYADGRAETIVGRALDSRRDEAFIVSKVLPNNAGALGAVAACDASLRRLNTDRIDLYLLHWRGNIALEETVEAFERLRGAGKILRWGVSNLDIDDMAEIAAIPEGRHCAANQVLYHLGERGIEWQLLPQCRIRQIPIMAYCPLAQGALANDPRLAAIARPLRMSPAQLALAWLLAQANVIAIVQSSKLRHVTANRAAAGFLLSPETLAELDAVFPPPTRPRPLKVI